MSIRTKVWLGISGIFAFIGILGYYFCAIVSVSAWVICVMVAALLISYHVLGKLLVELVERALNNDTKNKK